jgi:penicillin-binding protein 1A
MAEALETRPAAPFRIPDGLRMVRINLNSGRIARPGDKSVILEAFKPGTEPTGERRVIDGGYTPGVEAGAGAGRKVGVGAAAAESSGLY